MKMKRPKALDDNNGWVLVYAASFAAFLLIVFSANAIGKPICFSPEFIKSVSAQVMPPAIVQEHKGIAAKRIIDKLNKTGIPTDYVGDHVVAWVAPHRPPLQIVIFNRGCAVVRCMYARGCKAIPTDTAQIGLIT
jgi:hypothetical protein